MKLIILLIVCATVSCDILDDEWNSFKSKYGKNYKNVKEEKQRRDSWMKRRDYVASFNQQNNGYQLQINDFADENDDEIQLRNGLKIQIPNNDQRVKRGASKTTTKISLPTLLDYSTQGFVTPVKYQGNCGACWAFAVTAAVESQFLKKYGKNYSLSEQQLLDCTGPNTKYGNAGCYGGAFVYALQYMRDNRGVNNQTTYPYTAATNYTCQQNQTALYGNVASYSVVLPKFDESALKQALYKNGPLVVGIDASGSFAFYSSGIYYNATCSSTELNHGVLLVGWGTDNGTDYWLIKNSWSTRWGINGYAKLSRNRNNNCGIASYSIITTV